LEEAPKPAANGDEVLIKIYAASLNASDNPLFGFTLFGPLIELDAKRKEK
jgi:NADPH:quinone reductase-like Zn-dependent oxidoreductase